MPGSHRPLPAPALQPACAAAQPDTTATRCFPLRVAQAIQPSSLKPLEANLSAKTPQTISLVLYIKGKYKQQPPNMLRNKERVHALVSYMGEGV